MSAVDVINRNDKPLPSPRMGGDTYRSTRKAVPVRARKAYLDATNDSDDEPVAHEIDEADPAETFTLVPHVAEQTLHAVHQAIFGQPWADLELVVPAGGKKEEVVYANSKVLRKACPALLKQINVTGRAQLDTMEQVQSNAATDKTTAKQGLRPQASRRFTNSLSLVDYGGRNSRLGGLGDIDDDVHQERERYDEDGQEQYADSLAEQPKSRHHDEDEEDLDDASHQDIDNFDEDDLDSPLGSRSKIAGATPPRPAPIEMVAPPTFSRSSTRFSKLIKFMNKDKTSPTAENDAAIPFSSIGNASGPTTDYANDTVGRGRVRRYSAANELSSNVGTRASAAARVQVTGCSAATLQALVFYLYTGHATFASRLPARSSRRYRSRRDSISDASSTSSREGSADHSEEEVASIAPLRLSKSASFPPVFSATAAYCVGRQLGLRDLATKAFDHICLELSPKTVLADLLSPFVDRFDEVQRAHLEYVSENWDRVKRRPDFEQTVNVLVSGGYPKANKALLKLFAKLSVADRT
ncbi:uncharacterized protein MEPE_04241 [Melanopsichium pennsylvanicum]|uniref:BTB domain-containing protein n=2 Tax=Melanopsichium pennsylvanicum TaxID=63383 RepID=A0AAJ5C675_9BASI|nr:putative protein [Melanopsichium pennsylvanicum 4]SNX85532.1 uncharacterized protein MEPE_04241 [Melanopsichium pennsylvanicum]